MTIICISVAFIISIGFLLYLITMDNETNKKIKLLKKLLNKIIKVKNRDGFIMFSGFCTFIISEFNGKDRSLLFKTLEDEILKDKYSEFPVTYYMSKYSKNMDSLFYFERNNWDIRIKWLKEVIKNYKKL